MPTNTRDRGCDSHYLYGRHIGGLQRQRHEGKPYKVDQRPDRAIIDPRGQKGAFDFSESLVVTVTGFVRTQSEENTVLR